MILFPNAKINIGLYITEKRSDGFHNLETIFYPIDLCDILEIVPMERGEGKCYFSTTGIDIGGAVEDNLVVKAYNLLSREYRLPSINVQLHKMIPIGAGLGGGSSDATYLLKGLNRLFDLHIHEEQLCSYAEQLGSDCPFFIMNRPAFAYGRGELMEPLELSLSGLYPVIVKPDKGVSTKEAFAKITPTPAKFDLRKISKLPVEKWSGVVTNDFESSVAEILPEIYEIKDKLKRRGALYVSMTGSGSALYALFKEPVDLHSFFPDNYFVWCGK